MLNHIDPAALSALRAILETGSFDGAAAALGVTPSAITQRIQRLEDHVGAPLILRGRPCSATQAGRRLRQHADEVALLEHGLQADLGLQASGIWPRIRIALNADSLATWFLGAMAAIDGMQFDLVLDDQDHSHAWLQRGDVMAAITASPAEVRGCDVRPLGALAYRATASPDFMARWFADGLCATSLSQAPMLVFNAKDGLQRRWLEQQGYGRVAGAPVHWLPSTTAFVEAAERGIGWGLNPYPLVRDQIADGRLVDMGGAFSTPLYWHWNRRIGAQLAPVTQAVRGAARKQFCEV
ncbi:LysR family transcriptional regulator, chromosome initiation inhibitor [Monaibacterium marinum]|uniref:LysR family transcriptional regulator, chromosome initiation inhibitor n=1 Tax=Pontivivens marinum TaxID=1690039 RepID=A0A2C9CNI4_9RHOB|nr:LysR family transcriptional regulator ArgP [Monaibacterium marinum]SOH93091.1 LysR family transcriptional regulator, chromosome initiation inhibitor [Monaibacterium marinum]